MIVSGPVGNPESSSVHRRSPKSVNQSLKSKFLSLSLSTRVWFELEVREQMYLPASVRAMKRDILIVCEDIKFGRRKNKYIA